MKLGTHSCYFILNNGVQDGIQITVTLGSQRMITVQLAAVRAPDDLADEATRISPTCDLVLDIHNWCIRKFGSVIAEPITSTIVQRLLGCALFALQNHAAGIS